MDTIFRIQIHKDEDLLEREISEEDEYSKKT
jgi:hypothetical protein